MVTKKDRDAILQSLPDTGSNAFSRAITHPSNHPPSLLPPNTLRQGAMCDSEDSFGEGEVVEVINIERQGRWFWPPLLPSLPPHRTPPNLGPPPPPPLTPSGQCPPSPPPLLLPPPTTSSESRLPRLCPSSSPTLVLLSSSDEELEDDKTETPSKEGQTRSNPELPSELTGGVLSSLWNSKVAIYHLRSCS